MLHDFTINTYYNLADCLLKNLKVLAMFGMFGMFETLRQPYRLKAISVENKIKHCHHTLFLWNTTELTSMLLKREEVKRLF